MKLYTAKFDADHQDLSCTVTVPLDSSFGVAVGVKYQGKDVEIRKNEILLDGQGAIDVVDDKYAVFRLSSDGNAGVDSYEVKSVTDGMVVVEKSFKHVLTEEEAAQNPYMVKCETLNGLTIAPPMSDTKGKSPIYDDRKPHGWPLLLLAMKDGEAVYAGTPTYMYGVGADGNVDYSKPIAFIQTGSGAGFGKTRYELKVPNESYTNWVYGNEFTVPENGMFLYTLP